jgi:hypothetical protein
VRFLDRIKEDLEDQPLVQVRKKNGKEIEIAGAGQAEALGRLGASFLEAASDQARESECRTR